MKVSFLQMSDIHFYKHSGDAYDIDGSIRDGVVYDIKNNAKSVLGDINGLLICGDIAFSGQTKEYDIAKVFIQDVLDIFNKDMSYMYCVPGNHDVDQNIIRNSIMICKAHDLLIETELENADIVDNTLRNIMHTPGTNGILLEGINNYNIMAKEAFCNVTKDKSNWRSSMKLGDDYDLILWGLNSVYISSHRDHRDENNNPVSNERKMLMSRQQIPGVRDKTIYLSMCHHPPDCWSNTDISDYIDARVKIQLYGHKHIQTVDANKKLIRIYSGALQPERGKDWRPQYNWIVIDINDGKLIVDIYPRIYNDQEGKFETETTTCDIGKIFKRCIIDIEEQKDTLVEITHDDSEEQMADTYIMNNVMRNIIFKYMRLKPCGINELNRIYEDSDMKFTSDNTDEVVKWISEKGLEEEFWDNIRRLG